MGFCDLERLFFYSLYAIQKGVYFNLDPCPAEGGSRQEANNLDSEQKGVNVRPLESV